MLYSGCKDGDSTRSHGICDTNKGTVGVEYSTRISRGKCKGAVLYPVWKINREGPERLETDSYKKMKQKGQNIKTALSNPQSNRSCLNFSRTANNETPVLDEAIHQRFTKGFLE